MTSTQDADKKNLESIVEYRGQILNWYDQNGRDLPWRYKNGAKADPYRVWLSEIMCQQTTVQAVKAYYTKFLAKWPTVSDLANADQEEVMREWAGLGYYARARNLHKCANVVTNEMGGEFPNTQKQLKELPGIGDYTSAAIAAIAFGEDATVMDGNIERVMARFFLVKDALPKAKPIFKDKTALFFSGFPDRSGDLAQALMDIGSSICTPKNPKCSLCPIQNGCAAMHEGIQATLPIKTKKKPRPRKIGDVYWIENGRGEILLHKRPEKGLLGGMIALPTSDWRVDYNAEPNFNGVAALSKNASITHVFTHFDLTLNLYMAKIDGVNAGVNDLFWGLPDAYEDAFPTVFKKAYKQFIKL